MADRQPDLFSCAPPRAARPLPETSPQPLDVAHLDDDALVAAIADANLEDTVALVAEVGRRRLVSAVPVLVRLCRRHAGFGVCRSVPEQEAALHALDAIGGREPVCAVARMIERVEVQGPTLAVAVTVAARLGSVLSVDTLCSL